MRIIRIDKNNQVNGDGLRCVIWFAGCNHQCPGCHNPETWDFNCGHDLNIDDMDVIYDQLERDEISGITLTGGDPIYQYKELLPFLEQIKINFPNKTIWCYTGFNYEEIDHLPVMEFIDVLIDGKYISSLNPGINKILWRGSTNQRIIDVQKSLDENSLILYEN